MKKIAVVGIGYVGLSMSLLLSRDNEVVSYDVDKLKIDMLNNNISPIKDEYIEEYLKNNKLNLKATLDYKIAFKDANYIIICTPTNYDEDSGWFDTTSIEKTIEKILEVNKNATIVIKSTIPVGYTNSIREKYNINNIFFSPEFLREDKLLYDNLYPSRIIVGAKTLEASGFGKLLKEASYNKDVMVKYMESSEAEAVKLFSNTYLALRIAFFNELDTYAEVNSLNTKDIIEGVCLDPRVGMYYNNPSFGYGGYCLPKDTKQILVNYKDIPQNIIKAVVDSNDTRKEYIVNRIMSMNPKVVGVYRLTMKQNSNNFRMSAIHDIVEKLNYNNIKIIIYEPLCKDEYFNGYKVVNDFQEFNKLTDLVIFNRGDENISKISNKVYTRDIFMRD